MLESIHADILITDSGDLAVKIAHDQNQSTLKKWIYQNKCPIAKSISNGLSLVTELFSQQEPLSHAGAPDQNLS